MRSTPDSGQKEDVELDTLSEWMKSIGELLKRRIGRLRHSVNNRHESIFHDPVVAKELSDLHEKYIIVPADNFTFVCKAYYLECLREELGLHSAPGNPTYTLTNLSVSELLDNHISVFESFGIHTYDSDLELPYIYWIPKMHKNPYQHRFNAGSSRCSTKTLSILLTKILTRIKEGLQTYCETTYSRNGINQMWILKNSKELLENLKATNFNHITSIKSFDFFTLYTTIPHQKLKNRLANIIRNTFLSKNGNRRYKYLVIGHEDTYFVKEHSDSNKKYTEDDMIRMLEIFIDNIFVVFGGTVFQQIVGIPMGTNCAPLLADLFLYSYEADFIQTLRSTGRKHLASQFNFTFRYIDDVLSINNPKFKDHLHELYPHELEIKETTESDRSASYLDILLSFDANGHLNTSLYDKRDDFSFHITNFPFMSSNIPSSPAYVVFVSQLIRYGTPGHVLNMKISSLEPDGLQVHTYVRDVSPIKIPGSKKVKWNVVICDTRKLDEVQTEIFDSVFMCSWNGRIQRKNNAQPGLSSSELFEGLNVAVLGAHYTGEDVSMQIARQAKKFCTGYRYSFPFLKNDVIQINDERITPIYKQMIHIKYPSLIFFNIPRQWSYFTHLNEFAKLAVPIIDGRTKLPTEEEMMKESEEDFQSRLKEGLIPRYAHYMGDIDRQWRYNEELAKMGGFPPLPPVLEKLWDDIMDERYMNITHNTEFNYEVTGHDSYRILNPEGSKTRLSKASG
ncbi:hypothetical protein FSP39_005718 [Pinctada imbricata]|uniref:Flavin-containing monooxygenase n=1 Tax=Pinctada imbricata TaxID=66713 RepID=A0AA88XZG3_PINIB|nr:hypothetical protein FSP39_005718 [Pinctada imbricata]